MYTLKIPKETNENYIILYMQVLSFSETWYSRHLLYTNYYKRGGLSVCKIRVARSRPTIQEPAY